MKKVSIIIPVYNRKADLERCISSVYTADMEPFEIIAVDDGSTDGSYEVLQSFSYPNLKIYKNQKNKGVNYTRNRGIEKATGEYICFLDSDDKLMPGALDVIKYQIDKNNTVKHFLFYDFDFNETLAKNATHKTTYQAWLTEKVYGDFTHVIKRDILLKFPFFEKFRAYENLNWLRIFKETSPQKVVPVVVKWRDINRTDNLTKTLSLNNSKAILEKFNYLVHYFKLYGTDLFSFDPVMYKKKMNHTIMLGIAASKKRGTLELIESSRLKNKAFYNTGVSLVPSFILNKLITNK